MTNNTPAKADPKIKVLLEMRPALEGFAGIPQETRLLFRGLTMIDAVEVEGMIQHPHRTLARGLGRKGFLGMRMPEARRLNRMSRVIISMVEQPFRNVLDVVRDYVEKKLASSWLTCMSSLGISRIRMTRFESKSFEDFTWRTLFAKTLPASDRDLVSGKNHRICSVPWKRMHTAGLASLNIFDTPKYPTLDTNGVDVFIGQTPFPATVLKGTAMVIRYHDAIPVFMPHTIPEKTIHQATHFYGLMGNVKAGAYFACVSEATRQDLLQLFPEAEKRSVVIHNMVSHHYFLEDSDPANVPRIIRSRLYSTDSAGKDLDIQPKFLTLRERDTFYRKNLETPGFRYLLVVSTIEPRKNHTRLLAAWEAIKAEIDPDLKLVVVGTLGWDNGPVMAGFRSWIDRGELFMLNAVPAPDLRVLYRHAAATVCPSLGEGFDFSGVESMGSGGVTVASDIPVHREVYDDAAEYFDPYATSSLLKALKKVMYSAESVEIRSRMVGRGQEVAARYQPDRILPQWEAFLARVAAER